MNSAITQTSKPTPRWLRWNVAVALIAIACVGAYYLKTYHPGASANREPIPPTEQIIGGLSIELTALESGEVWETKDHVCRLPIRNRSGNPIQVTDLIVSCNCSSVAPRQLTIPAGETAEVELKIDLTHRLPHELAWAVRPFTVQVTPILKPAISRPSGWIVHGIVKSRVTLDTDFLQFGESPVQGQAPVTRRVVVTTHVPTERLEIRSDPHLIAVQIRRRAETTFDLTVSPNSNLPLGLFRTELGIDLLAPSGERLSGMTLPVAGTVQPAVRLLPARVFLGSHPVGQTPSAVVVIQAPAGVVTKVDQIETDSSDVSVTATEVDGIGPGRAFRVTQTIRETGDRVSVLRFFVSKGGLPPTILTVDVVYRGEPKDWIGQSSKGATP